MKLPVAVRASDGKKYLLATVRSGLVPLPGILGLQHQHRHGKHPPPPATPATSATQAPVLMRGPCQAMQYEQPDRQQRRDDMQPVGHIAGLGLADLDQRQAPRQYQTAGQQHQRPRAKRA